MSNILSASHPILCVCLFGEIVGDLPLTVCLHSFGDPVGTCPLLLKSKDTLKNEDDTKNDEVHLPWKSIPSPIFFHTFS